MSAAPEDPVVLYWSPGSCARVTLVALEEAGLPYEHRVLARGRPGEMEAFARSVNPKGKVPALVVGSRVLTETPALVTYLDGVRPQAGLLPDGPDGPLDALVLMSWFAGGIHPLITRSRFPRFVSADPGSFDSIRAIALDGLRDCFGQVESRLSDGRQWLFGSWTVTDVYLLWLWFRGVGSGLTAQEFPLVDDLARRCQQRPTVTRVLDLETEEFAALQRAGMAIRNPPPLQAGWLPEPEVSRPSPRAASAGAD
jgi:glutathione S-transferase